MSVEELETIGNDYYLFLEDLNNNSRPIISNLTQIAQENVNAAPYITKAIEKRIDKAIPSHKLYAFYLLDSICKNTGSPYTLLFGHNLLQTFTKAYLLVDEATRKKFIDLFRTWKSAKNSSGLPLFPNEPIDRIEQFLIRASSIYSQTKQQQQQPPSVRNSATPTLPMLGNLNNFNTTSNLSLIPIIDKLLRLTNQRLLANPHDNTINQKLTVINTLKVAVQAENLAPAVIEQIRGQLDDMTKQEESYLRSLSPTPVPVIAPQPKIPDLSSFLAKQETVQPIKTNENNTNNNTNNNSNSSNALNPNLLNNILNLKAPTLTTPKPKKDLSDLLSKLQQKGLVKPSNSIPSTSVLKSLLSIKPISSLTVSSKDSSKDTSESLKLLQPFNISSKFLTVDAEKAFKVFFQVNLPNKCGTCGKRFDNSSKGLEKRREHLDWHFRINKKLKEGSIVQSRSWYLDDEDFVNFRDDEIFTTINDNEVTSKEKEEVKKEKRYVVVPADSTDMRVVCGICKEVMNGEYDDDLGEWIFKDAVEANGKIFHENCFNETNKNGMLDKLILKRDRNDDKKIDMNLLKNIVGNFKSEVK